MLEDDKRFQSKPYEEKRLKVWFTDGSDLEACWIKPEIVSAHFGVDLSEAQSMIDDACDRSSNDGARTSFNTKRNELTNFIKAYQKGESAPIGSAEAHLKLQEADQTFVHLGKDLMSHLRKNAQEKKLKSASSFGKFVPDGVEIAPSLKSILQDTVHQTSS